MVKFVDKIHHLIKILSTNGFFVDNNYIGKIH